VFFRTAGGRLTKEKLAGLGLPDDASAYICGPASGPVPTVWSASA
jgi:hypothetical protein